MATCKDCGMTIAWDCDCDTELNRLISETLEREANRINAVRQQKQEG